MTNENAFLGQSFGFVRDNSGMTPAVNNGDSLATALGATHVYGGFTESFVTVDSTADFFATGHITIAVGINTENNRQQVRFGWSESIPNTSVIGACEFVATALKQSMVNETRKRDD